ncbi:peptide-methionine (S)-S-oxide reductase MsrA [Candidatus Saccharibacteria bacterium]|nr:peptide-methionine (S)-S-oxide reductase MsrA [Candidatus Saccharibacteria bacterium]
METIVIGGGCFWCLEATFQLVRGVDKVLPGYAGGTKKNPSYDNLHSEDTGHAEVVEVTFNPTIINLADILEIFWVIHDPTTKDRQGNDVGSEYRSVILWSDDTQKRVIDKSLIDAQRLWDRPIVTEVKKLDVFYEAEAYHHNYFQNHPEQAYCQLVINPKLQKLKSKFANKLK